MVTTPEGIELQQIDFKRVVELVGSPTLNSVEQPIADTVGLKILEPSALTLSWTMGELSVGGIPVDEFEDYLESNRKNLIAFGIEILRDEHDLGEEYPEGEEQDPPGDRKTLGLGAGFGITHAIFFHYTFDRTAKELREYLKNRRMPHRAKYAKLLEGIRDDILAR